VDVAAVLVECIIVSSGTGGGISLVLICMHLL